MSTTPAVQSLARRLEGGGVCSCTGIHSAAHPFLAALVHQLLPRRTVVVVTEGLRTQESFQQDLSTWLRTSPLGQAAAAAALPLFYPAWEVLPHEARLPHADVVSDRLETLLALRAHRLASGYEAPPTLVPTASEAASSAQQRGPTPAPVIVSSVTALLQRTFPPAFIAERTRSMARGDRVDPLDLVEWLEEQGYEPEAQVTQKGEIALRGGILDLFPLTSPWPVRLEFFGDELESLRHFDPLTQISREEIAHITLPPAGELGILQRTPAPASGWAHFVEHLPAGTVLLLCNPELLAERAQEYSGQVPAGDPFFIDWDAVRELANARSMTLLNVSESDFGPSEPDAGAKAPGTLLELDSRPPPDTLSAPLPQAPVANGPRLDSLEAFRPLLARAAEPAVAEAQRREFFGQLHRWLRQGYAVHLFCNNDGEHQRFDEIWAEYGLAMSPAGTAEPAPTPGLVPVTHLGTLARGFLCDEAKAVVITDAEVFGRYKVQRPRRLKSPHAQATRSALDINFSDLEEGDYVVHLQHGIGRYAGLHLLPPGAGTKPTDGTVVNRAAAQECLVIEYASADPAQPPPKLYVPVTEAHLVSKYIGTGKARPPLNTLGGVRWAKAKAQAERAVRDVASELLAIQAARESQAGHPFGPDTPWQREFESAFIFEETPDQMRAIVETKKDMETPKPMDRLICGDVGFGKTEVGIRAAFKAVMGGKQAAVLVPTTVLAQQHFNTFRERMADYPIRVELLSRFRSRRAQQQVVRDLASGAVDIVIGTHRLLQADIVFRDLGLVVIDEEQRFGVVHKEKFKMLRRLVDVLTLSATPIPRTLYLALSGARDMSTIQTPPHDRLPVETVVTQYDERVIRDAIQRELNRGGQVFFLHNRVLTIHAMAQKVQALLPHVRLVIGHGQMHSDELEEVMTQFVNGEADVLLSTTIIESGLDIPNANTIIIDRADRFGLSDLYQLRGRVGRYKHQAYAYLLLPRHARLLTDVRKRLSAIKQYSTLGSGFKIAMRDLEIRGAGNLLGSQQSGHITAVGFDLYCQLLKQSVAALKGEKVKPRVEVQVRLDFLGFGAELVEPTAPAKSSKTVSPEATPNGKRSYGIDDETSLEPAAEPPSTKGPSLPPTAGVPFKYISDARQRIEVYRKLAQVSEKADLEALQQELRDRFGPIPRPLELLLLVGELKILAAERGVTLIEVRESKLMLTRNNDYIMLGNKFPRLTKIEARARLKEIKKLLLVL